MRSADFGIQDYSKACNGSGFYGGSYCVWLLWILTPVSNYVILEKREGDMKTITVRQWIIRYILIVILPLILTIGILFSYMITSMSNSSVVLSEKTMELYVNQLNENLNSMERILLTIYDNNMDLSYLCVSEDRNQLYMSKIAFANYLNRESIVFDRFDGLFTMIQREDELIYIDEGTQDKVSIKQEMTELAVGGELQNLASSNHWFTRKIGDKNYLMRITQNGRSYCGAWICLEPIADFLRQYCDISGAETAICDRQDKVVSQTSEKSAKLTGLVQEKQRFFWDNNGGLRYAVGYTDSAYANLKFFLFIPTNVVLREVHILEWVAGLVLLMVLGMILIFWKNMNVRIISPCMALGRAMEQIEDDAPLSLEPEPLYEYGKIQQGFNEMKSQIHHLKIQSYEQQIKEQKIHMEYLFGQMQPHFFLNALNVIYSFAEIQRYDLIQEMVMAMVRYLRYVFNNGSKPVALKEELAHIEDFITIQQIRYPDRIIYEKDIDTEIEESGVLPFLLQTFVENCIKYGLRTNQVNTIKISARRSGHQIVIVVSDTGKGFTQEEMQAINGVGEEGEENRIYKVGIRNTRQRLKLMYGDDAEILVGNRECGGAFVNIWFPENSSQRGCEGEEDESTHYR